MKISDLYQQSNPIQHTNENNPPKPLDKPKIPKKGEDPPSSTDKVELSVQSKEINRINDILKETPEVRSEKIAALKKQIEEGKYNVDAEAVAERMIKESILDFIP
jgi:negative regulator of flagellin synthesis FlgM